MIKFPQYLIQLAQKYNQQASECDVLLDKLEDELSLYAYENGLIAEGKDVGDMLYRLLDSLPETLELKNMNYIEIKPNGTLYEVSSCFDTNFAGKAKNYIYQGNLAQSVFTAKLVYNNDENISAIIVFDTDDNIIESLSTSRDGISLKEFKGG